MASVLASAKPVWLNFGQHRGPTYSYNNGSKKRQNWWARFTISIANNKHNTKGHRVIKIKDLNKNWLATWHNNVNAAASEIDFCNLLLSFIWSPENWKWEKISLYILLIYYPWKWLFSSRTFQDWYKISRFSRSGFQIFIFSRKFQVFQDPYEPDIKELKHRNISSRRRSIFRE